jgi:hypothetical protein
VEKLVELDSLEESGPGTTAAKFAEVVLELKDEEEDELLAVYVVPLSSSAYVFWL